MELSGATAPAWHAVSPAETVRLLTTHLTSGLDDDEAVRRLAQFGPNRLGEEKGPGPLVRFLGHFNQLLVWILLAAAVISGILLDEWIDAGVILAIVVLNAVLGFVQESRAEKALARLKEMAAPKAVLIRSGRELRVDTHQVVPGDVLVLEGGDKVAADARLVSVVHLEADESALTGESLPVAKTLESQPQATSVADRHSMVFAGTVIASGRGHAIVTATGNRTEVGEIAALLEAEEPPTPLQVELDRVGKRLAVLALAAAALIFVVGMWRGFSADRMFLTAVALAVASIPEGLPAVVTITLARGVQRMARSNAIVRRLPAVEALGSASVICTDKTGTLTRNQLRVQELVLGDGRLAMGEANASDPRLARCVEVAALCTDARSIADGYQGDPTEIALLILVEQLGSDVEELRSRHPRLDEVAFDSRRMLMTTLSQLPLGYLVAVKGAPEVVVGKCTEVESRHGKHSFTPADQERVLEDAAALASGGLRTLALAYREIPAQPARLTDAEAGLTLAGIVAMSDEPRPEVTKAVEEALMAGIQPVMVTGDHVVTGRAVAERIGLLAKGGEVMSGRVLAELSAEALSGEVDRYAVFARVDPVDKVKIVTAWQSRGAIVAMTGDGINDAPALRIADIGVAMGSGSDVAKESAAMVLADDNFATIVAAVKEGRGIFSNLQKVVYFLLSANITEVLVMLTGFLFFSHLGEPLLAVQLLWINLVTDGLPALALGGDPVSALVMQRPPDKQRSILSARRQLMLLGQGVALTLATFSVLLVGHFVQTFDWPTVRTMVFTTLVNVQLVHTFNVRAMGTTAFRAGLTSNRSLLIGMIGSFLLQVAVVYLPIGHSLFRTESLSATAWLPILGGTLAAFWLVDFGKRVALWRAAA